MDSSENTLHELFNVAINHDIGKSPFLTKMWRWIHTIVRFIYFYVYLLATEKFLINLQTSFAYKSIIYNVTGFVIITFVLMKIPHKLGASV